MRSATQTMPFEQAHALWLVDVCDCSYDQAALETGTSRDTIAADIADRRFVRTSLGAQQPGVTVS